MKTVVCLIDLGVTRTAGYTLYDEISREFLEMTPREVKDLVVSGEVNGLRLIKGRIELDMEGFNMCNLMVKSGVGKYRTLFPNNTMANCMYSVVKVIIRNTCNLYEIISNKCARTTVTLEQLKMLMDIGCVAGVKMVDGKLNICSGVTFEDRTKKNIELKKATGYMKVGLKQNLKDGIDNDEVNLFFGKSDSSDVICDNINTTTVSKISDGASDNILITSDDKGKNKEATHPKELVGENKMKDGGNSKKK